MSTAVFLSYLLIIGGVVVWALLVPGRKKVSQELLDHIALFGGAFLLGSCFINLVPHLYLEGFVTPRLHVKVGVAVLVGFLVQILLDQLSHGVEHGHSHEGSMEVPVAGLMTGLCLHALMEGLPMVDADGDIHQGLLYGIVLHNIPIAIVLVSLFMARGFGFGKSLALLTLFAVMTPLGSLTGLYLLPDSATLRVLTMGLVVGILLHVSVSILFNHDHNRLTWIKFFLILTAFAAAYFTPGCPEIYSQTL